MNAGMLAVNIVIGSIIGGVTNELAIRMLFKPIRPWYVGKWKVPFTPGLIPRRRDDIAKQMGRLVEEHLLTTEGVRRALTQGGLEHTLSGWMSGIVNNWLSSERSLRDVLQTAIPHLFDEEGKWSEQVRTPVNRRWHAFVNHTLHVYEEKPLRDLLGQAGIERVGATLDTVSQLLLTRFRDYLHSPEGLQTLQNMIRGLLGGGGGMFGGLVGMFLGDDKILGKLLPYLDELLESPELKVRLRQFLQVEADKLLSKKVGELVDWIGQDQIDQWSQALFARLEQQSLKLVDEPLSRIAAPIKETVQTQLIPRLSQWMVETLQKNVERIFQKLAIREIVTRQVESFPIERIEEMVVGISGKEFRMITVLGFILGGIIGLIQGLLANVMG